VLKSFRESQDDKSYKSGGSIYSTLQHSVAWESLSGRSLSQASTGVLTTSKSTDVIRNICNELDMPPSFVEHALHELLGVDRPKGSKSDLKAKPPSTKAMISFMARAFKRCTQDARLVVVALDDLHNADELSWKVCREIFETVQNVLFIGSTYQTDEVTLKVEPDFWDELNNMHREEDRFVTMKLGCLNREEITSMIMKALGLQRKEVKDDVLEGVAIQSGGMPHFVNEILDHVKKQMALDPDFEITDVSGSLVSSLLSEILILHVCFVDII
jgi:predicted ATPase